MGSGKTTVGRLLARAMGLRFIDLDARIEAAAGMTVTRIFELEGEAAFRALERRMLREAAREGDVVVAAGGGAMTSAENRELMAARGTTVWLNPDFETLVDRISAQPEDQRPLFTGAERARELFEGRLASYRQADLTIDVGSEEEAVSVAERVAGLLREVRCAT